MFKNNKTKKFLQKSFASIRIKNEVEKLRK